MSSANCPALGPDVLSKPATHISPRPMPSGVGCPGKEAAKGFTRRVFTVQAGTQLGDYQASAAAKPALPFKRERTLFGVRILVRISGNRLSLAFKLVVFEAREAWRPAVWFPGPNRLPHPGTAWLLALCASAGGATGAAVAAPGRPDWGCALRRYGKFRGLWGRLAGHWAQNAL